MCIAYTGPKLCDERVVVHPKRVVPMGVRCRHFIRHEPRCRAPIDGVSIGPDISYQFSALIIRQGCDVLFLTSIRCDMDALHEDLLERIEHRGKFILIVQLGKESTGLRMDILRDPWFRGHRRDGFRQSVQ